MAINTTSKEMPARGCHPTADAINGSNFSMAQWPGKAFAALRAAFALRGHALCRTDPADSPVTYWAGRWGLVRYLPTLHDAALFLTQIGGRL